MNKWIVAGFSSPMNVLNTYVTREDADKAARAYVESGALAPFSVYVAEVRAVFSRAVSVTEIE